jgi:hypothetical protein
VLKLCDKPIKDEPTMRKLVAIGPSAASLESLPPLVKEVIGREHARLMRQVRPKARARAA